MTINIKGHSFQITKNCISAIGKYLFYTCLLETVFFLVVFVTVYLIWYFYQTTELPDNVKRIVIFDEGADRVVGSLIGSKWGYTRTKRYLKNKKIMGHR